MSSNDYLADIVAKLTYNGAANLRNAHRYPCALNPRSISGNRRIFTGLGKWTTLAAIGVENHLKSLGLAENSPKQTWGGYFTWITPLGREVAAYLDTHWDELSGTFREGGRR